MTKPFYIVDVFTHEKYTGNQLAVVRDAADLATEQMQAIALEMNYSETTFILSDEARDGGYDVRIFTNSAELPFAGHPTLGTAYIIAHEILGGVVDGVTLNLKVGQIPVTFSSDGNLWMRQAAPTFHETFTPDEVAETLGLRVDDFDERFTPQIVSTGMPFLCCPLKSREAVERYRPNASAYYVLQEKADLRWPIVFAPDPLHPENDLHARMLAFEKHGVWEDPATGSANGCLAAYLARHRYFGGAEVDCRVEQGYMINRPSILMLRSADHGESVEVNVGGGVVPVARGTLL